MPRPQRAYGRPGTQVIPADWGTSHAPVVTGTMPDEVSLRAPSSTATWNETTHRTEATQNTPFATEVPARIRAIGEARGASGQTPVAEDLVHVAGYMVSLPLDGDGVDSIVVDGESDTLIDVTKTDDAQLLGKTLLVKDIVRSSTRFERTLLCTLND